MREGFVYIDSFYAGIIKEEDFGYSFAYSQEYLQSSNPKPVSLTLPLQKEKFTSPTMFPFFDGLIPEGWLLNIAIDNWKLNPRDRMGLLLVTCLDPIGNVSVHLSEENQT